MSVDIGRLYEYAEWWPVGTPDEIREHLEWVKEQGWLIRRPTGAPNEPILFVRKRRLGG